jgi:SH3 domain-containing protein
MKINVCFSIALLLLSRLGAAPLTSTTAVHVRPETSSPVITVLNAGTEPTPAVGFALALPKGWSAIDIAGPHEAYLANRDLLKSMDARNGAAFRTLPKADAPILTTMQAGDQMEITGYKGKWTQVKLTKKIVGYIQGWSGAISTSAAAGKTVTPSPAPAPTNRPTASVPFSPSPGAPAALASGGAGRPAQMVDLGDGGSSSLPRLFQGKLVSTRSLLHPRRPYDYQLNDSGGQRYAYVDVSKLLQTEQIEKYLEHTITVYGTAKPVPDSKDIVIAAESLQLR